MFSLPNLRTQIDNTIGTVPTHEIRLLQVGMYVVTSSCIGVFVCMYVVCLVLGLNCR